MWKFTNFDSQALKARSPGSWLSVAPELTFGRWHTTWANYMAPERITGQSYTITSDVWSLGVTLLEVAQHRFPFPADGTEMNPRAGLIDLLTYIVRQPIPKLKDEPENGIRWSENFKYFIECWYVRSVYLYLLLKEAISSSESSHFPS